MKSIKTSSPPRLAALLFGAALFGLASQSALAAGTASTTVVANLAKLSYAVGGVAQGDICSAPGAGNSTADDDGTCVSGAFGALNTDFAVDNKVDLLVTEVGSAVTTVVAGQTAAVATFTVKNEGNTTQDFSLAVANLATLTANPHAAPVVTDNFDGTACTVFNIVISAGAMGTYTALDQHINALTAESIATVSVTCNIPAAQANGSLAVISLTATARADNAANTLGVALAEVANTEDGVEIVFGDSAGSDDAPVNANHSARDAYFVQTATLTVTKTMATLCDSVTGTTTPHNIPGGMVRWTITIANAAGGGSASLASISDALSANTTLDPDLITGAPGTAAACEFAAAGAGTPESANTRSVRIQTSVARPMVATSSPGGTVSSSHFVADVADANADGVSTTGGVTVNFATAFPAGGVYTAGELKAGETVTVYFNAGIN